MYRLRPFSDGNLKECVSFVREESYQEYRRCVECGSVLMTLVPASQNFGYGFKTTTLVLCTI